MSSLCTPSQSLGSAGGMSQLWDRVTSLPWGITSFMPRLESLVQDGISLPQPGSPRVYLSLAWRLFWGQVRGWIEFREAGAGGTPQLRQFDIPPQEYLASTPNHPGLGKAKAPIPCAGCWQGASRVTQGISHKECHPGTLAADFHLLLCHAGFAPAVASPVFAQAVGYWGGPGSQGNSHVGLFVFLLWLGRPALLPYDFTPAP